jgi:hypothetical protein
MGRQRKYRLPTPPPMKGEPSPAEIIEAPGKLNRSIGTAPVELIPAGPPVEIIEAFPLGIKLDPNRPLAPTEAEVAQLPRWARGAYASRCARRLLPLLNVAASGLNADQKQAVRAVVRAVEQSAIGDLMALKSAMIKSAAQTLKQFAENVGSFCESNNAIRSALAAARLEACQTAQLTVATLQRLATTRTLRFALLPRRDFDHLLKVAKKGKWTDDTPVSPEVFGPLWDRTPPSWWQDEHESSETPNAATGSDQS